MADALQHARQLDVAVGDQHARRRSARSAAATPRRSSDRSAIADIAGWRWAASSGPGATRNSVISRLPNEMMKPNSAAATTPGLMTGSVTLTKRLQRRGAEILRRFLDRAVESARLAVSRRTVHGIVIMMCARTSPAREPRSGSSRRELDFDLEHVDRRAGDDAGNDQRQHEQRVERLAPGKFAARQHEARRHAEDEPADHRRDAHLQAREEAADEIVLVEDVREPAQRVALRRERHDLVREEAQPADEEDRRQDDARSRTPRRRGARCGRARRESTIGARAARKRRRGLRLPRRAIRPPGGSCGSGRPS